MTKIALMLSILAAGALMAVDDPAARERAKSQALQRELVATLEEAANVASVLHRSGRLEPSAVLQAQHAFLYATLDASETRKERISILENAVKMHKELEAVLEARKANAKANSLDILNAKAERIRTEIALEKEKATDEK